MTIQEFIAKYRISMYVTKVNHNPNMHADVKWEANHFEVTFKRENDRYGANPNSRVKPLEFFTFYSMGLGNKGKPEASGVLSCIISDADALENSFEEWAGNLGYDSDSRKALETYLVCQILGSELRSFLGISAYNELRECERE